MVLKTVDWGKFGNEPSFLAEGVQGSLQGLKSAREMQRERLANSLIQQQIQSQRLANKKNETLYEAIFGSGLNGAQAPFSPASIPQTPSTMSGENMQMQPGEMGPSAGGTPNIAKSNYLKNALLAEYLGVEMGKPQTHYDSSTGKAITTYTDLNGNTHIESQQIGPTAQQHAFSTALGKANAEAFEESSNRIFQSTEVLNNLNEVEGLINEFPEEMLEATGPVSSVLSEYGFGPDKERELVGQLNVISGDLVKQYTSGFKGQTMSREIDLANKSKINSRDSLAMIKGKLKMQRRLAERSVSLNREIAEAIENGASQSQAIKIAQQKVPFNSLFPQEDQPSYMDRSLWTPENIKKTAEDNNMTEEQVIQRLEMLQRRKK